MSTFRGGTLELIRSLILLGEHGDIGAHVQLRLADRSSAWHRIIVALDDGEFRAAIASDGHLRQATALVAKDVADVARLRFDSPARNARRGDQRRESRSRTSAHDVQPALRQPLASCSRPSARPCSSSPGCAEVPAGQGGLRGGQSPGRRRGLPGRTPSSTKRCSRPSRRLRYEMITTSVNWRTPCRPTPVPWDLAAPTTRTHAAPIVAGRLHEQRPGARRRTRRSASRPSRVPARAPSGRRKADALRAAVPRSSALVWPKLKSLRASEGVSLMNAAGAGEIT